MSERDKFLTEAMGGKVRNVTSEKREFRGLGCIMFLDFVCSCCNGPQSACGNYATDFSTWQGFGKLWDWMQNVDNWKQFQLFCMYGRLFSAIHEGHELFPAEKINPDLFANAVYEFLKGRENE